MFRRILFVLGALFFGMISAKSQSIVIDGLADRVTRTNSATFRVQTNAGFSYVVTLNGVAVPAGVFNTVTRMDYYDLLVTRTDLNTLAVTNTLVRFIIESSNRLKPSATTSPELGLIEWVPLPPTPSTDAEMAGANLVIMTPQDYPAGLDIPVIARVEDGAGNARRINGFVRAPGFEANAFRILRGHGHGFLPKATNGTITYDAQMGGLQTTRQINIEPTTIWTTASGILVGDNFWNTNSRIHVTAHLTIPAGGSLTIQEGTVVRLSAGVNITNNGTITINGTASRPVVLTPTNRVSPEIHGEAWGGIVMRNVGARLIANNAIMTGSGSDDDFDGAGKEGFGDGSSHRDEQPLLLVHSNTIVRMTNCALVSLAGQVGNGYFSSTVWDHCLVQRAITVGEWEGCTNIIDHSALIEFPSVDGVYDATIVDADYDGIYMIKGTNFLSNTLVGWAKDDAIDYGSGGPGSCVLRNCWVESALHEALAWSGEGRRTWTYDTVLMNSGQGIECGWSTGSSSPLVNASNLLSTGNSVGARFGDNYTGTGGLGLKNGFLTLTNSFILNNYRDVWGQVWDNTWNYRSNQMDIRSNFLTSPNGFHPSNTIWNPAAHGPLLAPFMATPPDAPVGIGLALWSLNIQPANLTNGIPVRLSSFTTNFVSVDYAIEIPGNPVASGTLTFAPGETVKNIFGNPSSLGGAPAWRVGLQNPVGGEITGSRYAYALPALVSTSPPVVLSPLAAAWKYLDNGSEQGTAWRGTNFNDSNWSNGIARLGFGTDAAATTTIRRFLTGTSGPQGTNYYFRRAFNVANTASFESLQVRYQRDDGCVVYLNGIELFRNNMPAGPITANTFSSTTVSEMVDSQRFWTNLIPANLLRPGTNILAAEVHQATPTSSDIVWECEVQGLPPATLVSRPFDEQLVLRWNGLGYLLEQADDVTGPWTPVANSDIPTTIDLNAPRKFYRLRK